MATVYGPKFDQDVYNWSQDIVANGGSVSADTVNAVLNFTLTLKSTGIWSKLKEVYILSGVPDLNSSMSKLKYISTARLTNSGTLGYTATGSECGVSFTGPTVGRITTSVPFDALPVKDRAVAYYETRRGENFYDTMIGRERGGGNSAFGPTVNDVTPYMQGRALDTTTSTTTVDGGTNTAPKGLAYLGASATTVDLYTNKTWYPKTHTLGDTIGGTGSYVIGGAIGGGGYSNSTIALGFMMNYLNQTETQLLSNACDVLMARFGGAK